MYIGNCVIINSFPYLKSGGSLIIEDIFDDERSPEDYFEEVVSRFSEHLALATFIFSKNRHVSVGEWNNEKLLLLVKK